MADGPKSTFGRVTTNAYKSLFGGDKNLPIDTATDAVKRRKKEGDDATRNAIGLLGGMLKGKSPIK